MSKESRREARQIKEDRYQEKARASAARVAADKRDADIRAGRVPDPQPKGADTTRY